MYLNLVEAQSPLPLKTKPLKSEITLYSVPDNMIGALFLLKDSSILVSNSLVKEDYYNGNYEVAELYIDDINMISSRKGPTGRAGEKLIGGVVGLAAGVLVWRIVIGPPPHLLEDEILFPVYAAAGAGIGAITGAIIGSIKIKIPINGSMENYNRKKKKLGRYTVKYSGAPKY